MSRGSGYADAGVDIDLEAQGVQTLIKQLTYRRTGAFPMLGSVGHFAGLIEFGDMALALAVDGVGTKMLVADALQDWTTVGIDCIAMNVNDLFVMNLEPVAFVDYIAADGISIEKMRQIGVGLNEGARQANMNIVGGETATLKGLVTGLDLAGACLGAQKKDAVVTGDAIVPGDIIVGVPSTGVHSNGYTLARKVALENGGFDAALPSGRSVGEALLTPTRIYREALDAAAACEVHGMCHVTGGGLLNFTRLSSFGFDIVDPLPVPEILAWIREMGDLSWVEMYRTFNMGMGYAFVVPEKSLPALRRAVPDARVCGEVVKESGAYLRGARLR
ncbi:MAG: phosphoribosylformylglycinamidine cyclo-ligase [Methanofollis sp.]|nr:phosphoribosylformylglycinamidine cyclo-ligase [Methanofollis sp.]